MNNFDLNYSYLFSFKMNLNIRLRFDDTKTHLRKNQEVAVKISINNDFKSGIHFHATGTGKSHIALEIISEYHQRYPINNIIWLCEQKSILIEQFTRNNIKKKGYKNILKDFLIIDYSRNKDKNWYDNVNSASFWKKPILLVINRAFLVSLDKYKKIKTLFSLIIHDECHSIRNSTTRKFYTYITKKFSEIKCIGFSATPFLDVKPFDNILSRYTIYNAFLEESILPPKIKWITYKEKLSDNDILSLCLKFISKLNYKKIIVWCGIIHKCNELMELWKSKLSNYFITIDTSKHTDNKFEEFSEKESNAILFCACKHREGSDIKNLDCCIFLDKVENRNPKTFVQSIGRVLRKDKENKKKYGLIIDLKAKSCIKICDRMNKYLSCKGFPWNYKYIEREINGKKVICHDLKLVKVMAVKKRAINYTITDLIKKFRIKCPELDIYQNRLTREIVLIKEKNLANYLMRAVKILELIDFIPHVTRGSCGSSLICYLLGISNVDPVQKDISFARFLNEYRDNLPDIDFDFPHYLRDEVFLKLELNWPNQVARISNHVYWQEKSALREAIRKIGINKQIPKSTLKKFVNNLPKDKKDLVYEHKKKLLNTFRHYSLHCGGIVFFHEGVPDNLVINKKILNQIQLDKKEIAKNKNFKIDILSSRGISQLIYINGRDIDFSDCPYDKKTYEMLEQGDNLGVTLAESPLMRKAFMKVKPKSIKDLAICLAIIRPAARDARNCLDDLDNQIIFDDDIIKMLSKKLDITEGLADKYRRCICKNRWSIDDKKNFDILVNRLPYNEKKKVLNDIQKLRLYSFCKSHSYSYAQLIYKLAYAKANNPKRFWESTLINASSSYRRWVHIYEAFRNGVDIDDYFNRKNDKSIYAEARHKKFSNLDIDSQFKKFGYWQMQKDKFYPDCYFYKKDEEYYFGGLIAQYRILDFKKPLTAVCFIGVGPSKFIEIIVKKAYIRPDHVRVRGRAKINDKLIDSYNAHIARFY